MFQSPEIGGAVSKMSLSEEPESKGGTLSTDRKRVQVERAGSPVPSCLSMKSDRSMKHLLDFRGQFTGDQRVLQSLESSSLEEKSSEKLSPPKQDLADSLERDEQHNESIKRAQQELKTHLKKKFEYIFEGLAVQGHTTLLNEIYTELYIT
ncbi:hypothetical protein COCON_G00233460, partial [Conger conger]